MNKPSLITFVVVALVGLVGGCPGETEDFTNPFAQVFLGSSPQNVSGPDADNDGAVDAATDMLTGRRFDFTPDGFTIESGNVNSTAAAGSDFGVAGGALDVSGDQATVDLDVFSTNPDVSNARMEGSFSLSDASQALINPGDSFLMDWEVDFDYLGFPVSLNLQQQLTGADFIDQQE